MKFLGCSRCFTTDPSNRSKPAQEITNPLVITKRPVPKVLHPRDNVKKDNPSPTSSRKRRFPGLFRALTSWKQDRRRRNSRSSTSTKNVRKSVRVIETPPSRRMRHNRNPTTRTQRLIRMYEDRAQSPDKHRNQDFLIDPPASFSGDDSLESHQNFRNKLNTLDFRRMNTVALEEPSTSAMYRKNSYNESGSNTEMPVAKYAKRTLLEDFLQERLRIEQAMIDLLNGTDRGSILLKKSKNDDRKVRFKDEGVEVREGEQEEEQEKNKTLSIVELSPEKNKATPDNGRVEQETEIKLTMDPNTKVEDFYVERRTTYLKDKTVEDKALVLKLAPKGELERDCDDHDGMTRTKEIVFRNFGKLTF